ncbi:MAG: sigma-70 family RNA polymerase sigma factor [Solirubrobacterales bacterium]
MASRGGVFGRKDGSPDPLPAEEAAAARKRAATELIRSHDAVLRRTARRYSICADDAEDSYQRALEILLTKAPAIEGDGLVRWMQTVTKREALAVRRQRERLLSAPRPPRDQEKDPLDSLASDSPEPTDRAASRERVARSGEALSALKPQEVRALTLKAEGYSYAEIGEITGWTYTKINRCMAEGRKRFLEVFADIEEGRRCEELSLALSALADGEGGNGRSDEVELHLKSCAACRAKLRAFRGVSQRVAELLPAGPAMDYSTGGRAHEWMAERVSVVAGKVKETGYSVLARGASEDAVRVAGGGGTRGAGMAALGKVLAVCGATAAGSATCVATGLVDPADVVSESKPRPAVERSDRPLEQPVDAEVVQPAVGPPAAPVAEPTTPAPPTPTQQATREISFERSAPAPSGGGEFGGPSGGSGGSGGGGSGGGGFGFER